MFYAFIELKNYLLGDHMNFYINNLLLQYLVNIPMIEGNIC
jgi:hypothetical protein